MEEIDWNNHIIHKKSTQVVFLAFSWDELRWVILSLSTLNLNVKCFLWRNGSLWGSRAGFSIQLSNLVECQRVDFEPCRRLLLLSLPPQAPTLWASLSFFPPPFYMMYPLGLSLMLSLNQQSKTETRVLHYCGCNHSGLQRRKRKKNVFYSFQR